ncbi:MAG: DUF3299 domain-containing protein [bacterium]
MRKLIPLIAMVFLFSTGFKQVEPILELDWEDLLPEDEQNQEEVVVDHGNGDNVPLFEDPMADAAPSGFPPVQYGSFNTAEGLDGEYVKIPGFGMALEYASKGEVSEFLLVPYFGACVHVPPPPPNQTVYVTGDKKVKLKGMWDPIWVYGTMHVKRQDNDLASAAYTLELDKIEPYE